MSKRVPKTVRVRKAAVVQHDALTVEAVEAYLREILTSRPKRGPHPQCRTFNVRVTLGLVETQKLAYYCRRANMTPSKWLAMQATVATYHLKETEENNKDIHDMVMDVIERTEPGRVVVIKPETADALRQAAEFLGDGYTPSGLLNELLKEEYSGWEATMNVIGEAIKDLPGDRQDEILNKACVLFPASWGSNYNDNAMPLPEEGLKEKARLKEYARAHRAQCHDEETEGGGDGL